MRQSEPEERARHVPSAYRAIGLTTLTVAAATLALSGAGYALGLRINTSGSIPPGLYRLDSDSIRRGAIVLACLPPQTARFARTRGYVPTGSCPDGSAPVGKMVAALYGDTVDATARGMEVNGRIVPNTVPLTHDSEGRPLSHVELGRSLVGPNEVWLLSSYSPRSFDSRYFGPIPRALITARIKPVATTR